MVFFKFTPTCGPYGARVWILESAMDIPEIVTFLKKYCLWGGHDKEMVDGDGIKWFGWELPQSHDGPTTAVVTFLALYKKD